MSSQWSKLIGWLTVSLLVFAYIRHDYAKQTAGGYGAFMAYQTYRFQHFISNANWGSDLLGSLFVSWLVLGFYELIQYGLGKLPSRTN